MVSVCIPTYNGEKYLRVQLESVISQLSDKDEIVISDDNSTDGTLEIIEDFIKKYGSQVRLFKNERKGVIFNVENALKKAKGNVIFLSDQDDVWLPNKVEVCVSELEKSELVVSDCFVADKDLNVKHKSFFKINHSFQNKYLALAKNSYLGCCMAFNRSVLDLALPFPKNIPMHDIWIGNVAGFYFSVRFIPKQLMYYRRHGENCSNASEPTQSSVGEIFTYRYNIIKNLLKLHK